MSKRRLIRSWGDIAFDDDIILAVCEKTGYPQDKVIVAFNFILQHIKKEIKDPEKHVIRLPHLGHLYFKTEYARHVTIRMRKAHEQGRLTRPAFNRLRRLEKQVENFDAYYDLYTQDKKKFSVHKKPSYMSSFAFMQGRTLSEFEAHINETENE